jgi:hypothetical protein
MTRTDVRKVAWTLRLIGFGMLIGAAAVMFLGTERASAMSGKPPSTTVSR